LDRKNILHRIWCERLFYLTHNKRVATARNVFDAVLPDLRREKLIEMDEDVVTIPSAAAVRPVQ